MPDPSIYNEAQAYELAVSMDRAIYYVYLLKKGPTWSPDSTPEVDALQEAHLANLRRLVDAGTLVLNGPLLDAFQMSGEIRGIGASGTEAMRPYHPASFLVESKQGIE